MTTRQLNSGLPSLLKIAHGGRVRVVLSWLWAARASSLRLLVLALRGSGSGACVVWASAAAGATRASRTAQDRISRVIAGLLIGERRAGKRRRGRPAGQRSWSSRRSSPRLSRVTFSRGVPAISRTRWTTHDGVHTRRI